MSCRSCLGRCIVYPLVCPLVLFLLPGTLSALSSGFSGQSQFCVYLVSFLVFYWLHNCLLLLFLFFFVLFGVLNGQSPPQTTKAEKINQAVEVDGSLDEPVWESAPEITGFIQFQPERGNVSSLKTTVKILYDSTKIYFGFFCFVFFFYLFF